MTTALTTTTDRVAELAKSDKLAAWMLSKPVKMKIMGVVSSAMTDDDFVLDICQTFRNNPELKTCSSESLIFSLAKVRQLGLRTTGIKPGVHLIPRENRKTGTRECQVMIGHQGWAELMRRNPSFMNHTAEVVYRDDVFNVIKGINPHIVHEENYLSPNRSDGDIIGAYAIAFFKDGHNEFVVMDRAALLKRRDASPTKEKPVWTAWFPEMCKKTVRIALGKVIETSENREIETALQVEAENYEIEEQDKFLEPTGERRKMRLNRNAEIPKEESETTDAEAIFTLEEKRDINEQEKGVKQDEE